jgi:RimJ/RimL family protein N-acetyltransferase
VAIAIERITDALGARAFYDIDAETTPVDHPGLVAEPLDAIIAMLSNPIPSFEVAFYVGRAGDETVASGFLGLPQVENTHTCRLLVTVALGARRRGYGTEMAAFVLDEARRHGRTHASWSTGSPLGRRTTGASMSEKLGATAALASVRSELALSSLDRHELERQLAALRAGPSASYALRCWTGACPDDLVEGAAKLVPIVMTDAPHGELNWDAEVWDVARYREYETMLELRERASLATAAIVPSTGQMVAFTDLNVTVHSHRVVQQQGTAVVPEHRGHRLGLAVKTRNLVHLLDAYPDAERVQTVNAAENEHMIAVNAALGFEVVERSTTWQLTL